MMKKSIAYLILILFLFQLTLISSATEFGYNNLNKPTLSKTVVNYTQQNVNSSEYWGTHPSADYDLLVPYTGATGDVDLGSNDLTVNGDTLYVNSTSDKVGVGTTTPAHKLDVHTTSATGVSTQGSFDISTVAEPVGLPVGTPTPGGAVDAGLHTYFVTYVTAVGETSKGERFTATTTVINDAVSITGIPVSTDPRVTQRKIYRNYAGTSGDLSRYLTTINNNVDTTYLDVTADADLPAMEYGYYRPDTTSNYITVDGTGAMLMSDTATFLGLGAGESYVSAPFTTGFGSDTLNKLTTGSGNTAFGYKPLDACTTGRNNLAVGSSALGDLTIGGHNVAVGNYALKDTTDTSQNTAVGYYALENADGNWNVALGMSVGRSLTTGDSNVFLGKSSGYNANQKVDADNSMALGANTWTTASNQFVYGDANVEEHKFTAGNINATQDLYLGDDLFVADDVEIDGNINLPNTKYSNQNGIVYKDAIPFMHNFKYNDSNIGQNTFIGENAGNLLMGSTATATYNGAYNTGIGYSTLNDITNGYSNTAIGTGAGEKITTGAYNFALGRASLDALTTGHRNSAMGGFALTSATTGSENIGIGYWALGDMETGSNNIGFGRFAGRYIADGSTDLDTVNQGIYLGGLTKALEDGVTNEIVMGYGQTGHGSNTMTLGNDANTMTYLTGDVNVSGDIIANDTITALNNFVVGNETASASFRGLGDYYGMGALKVMEGLFAESQQYGAGLEIGDYNLTTTHTNIMTGTATFTGATGIIYDPEASFDATYEDQFMRIISSTPSIVGATAEITDYIDSTHVALRLGTAGDDTLIDLTDVSYVIYPHPTLFVGDNGVISMDVGEGPDARMEIHVQNGTGFTGVYIDDAIGADHHQGLTLDYKMGNYEGMVGMNIFMEGGDNTISNKDITMLLMEGDASTMDGSSGTFIDMQIIGQPISAGHMDGIHFPSGLSHLFEVGSSDILTSSFYENADITSDVTTPGSTVSVLESDNEYIYFGNEDNFTTLGVLLDTESSSNLLFDYYYCDSSETWQELISVTDTTNGFKTTGTIEFESPSDRGVCNKEYDGTAFSDTDKYTYIALKRTRNNNVIDPILDLVTISGASTNMYMTEDLLKLNPVDTAPETCTAINLGAIYFDISEDDMCQCASGGWEVIRDGSDCS